MAYYYDNGYLWPQEHTTYDDLVSSQDSISFSDYESDDLDTSNINAYSVSQFHEPTRLLEYYYDYDYDYGRNSYTSANPEINYFAYNYVEPKLIAYQPVSCDTGYVSYHTHCSIAKSEMDSGFNEPEFEEYDPTPYGGGYDIVSVYGKPLPPSDKTCYPRSKPKPIGPNPESKPKPDPEPKPVILPTPIPLVEPKTKPELEPMSKPEHVPVLPPPKTIPTPVPLVQPEPELERDKEEYNYPNYGYDYPWPEYDHGYGLGVGYDYGYGKQVVQVPPIEYNPQVVDLCESIFGNWPCLARIRRQQMATDHPPTTCPRCGNNDPWEDCVNYFFGCPIGSSNQ